MSPDSRRPGSARQHSINPAFWSSNIEIPVTPGIHTEGQDAYFDPQQQHHSTSPTERPFRPRAGTGSQWNANAFSGSPERTRRRTSSAAEAAAGARDGEDLLRRLSMAGQRPKSQDPMESDPKSAYPTLNLSGNIISATFAVPHSIGYTPGEDWVRGVVS